MRAVIESFLAAYGIPAPPAEIRQQPLDGDPGHYARLSALDDGALPAPRDFGDYADDIWGEKGTSTLFGILFIFINSL